MRRIRPTAVLVLVLALAAAGCGDDDDEPAATTDDETATSAPADLDTVSDGRLSVCSDIPYAPFEFEEGGEVVGIDADLMRAIGEELGLDVTFKDTDFDGIFAALAAEQCDVVASAVSITDERKESMEFSAGYFEIQQSVLVRQDDAETYTSLESLKGKTIGVQSETTGEAYAQENAKDSTVKSFTGADELFTALRAGQVDAVLQDFPVNAYHAETTGETAVSVKLDSDPEEYGFAIRKGNTELRDAIDGALEALRDDGRYDEILEKYLGAGAAE